MSGSGRQERKSVEMKVLVVELHQFQKEVVALLSALFLSGEFPVMIPLLELLAKDQKWSGDVSVWYAALYEQ